jgi:hypothetical protein
MTESNLGCGRIAALSIVALIDVRLAISVALRGATHKSLLNAAKAVFSGTPDLAHQNYDREAFLPWTPTRRLGFLSFDARCPCHSLRNFLLLLTFAYEFDLYGHLLCRLCYSWTASVTMCFDATTP